MALTTRFDQALAYTATIHRQQIRKGTTIPYLAHLLAVAALTLEMGGNEEEAIAALLHDAVEDCGGMARLADIEEQFGAVVAGIVAECTDSVQDPKPPWRERKLAYLSQIPHKSSSARLVSCCDKLHNASAIVRDYQSVGEVLWSRFTTGKSGTLWYYRSLANTFLKSGPTLVAVQLEEVVCKLENLTALS